MLLCKRHCRKATSRRAFTVLVQDYYGQLRENNWALHTDFRLAVALISKSARNESASTHVWQPVSTGNGCSFDVDEDDVDHLLLQGVRRAAV